MSYGRPSGAQTAVCHNNHGRVRWTQRDKTTMKQAKTKRKESNGEQGERAELYFGTSNLLTRSKGISLSAGA